LAFQTCSWFYFERNQAKPSERTSTRISHSLNFPKRPGQPLFTCEALWHSEHKRSAACGAWDCSGLSYQQLWEFGNLSPDGISPHPGRRLCPWYDRRDGQPVIRACSFKAPRTPAASISPTTHSNRPPSAVRGSPRGRCVTTFAPEGGDCLLRSSTFFAPGAPIQVIVGLRVKLC
jgi:hypothetical protein